MASVACPTPYKKSFPNPESAYMFLDMMDQRAEQAGRLGAHRSLSVYKCRCGGLHTTKYKGGKYAVKRPVDMPKFVV